MKLDWKYFMNSIDEAIEMLAINRKGAIDNDVAKEVVDEYIYNQAQKMFDKLESYDDEQMVRFMLGRMLEKAPKELLEFVKEEDI